MCRRGGVPIPVTQRSAESAERDGLDLPPQGTRPIVAEVTIGLVQPSRGCMAVDHLPTVRSRTVGPATRTTNEDVGINPQGGKGWREYGKGQSMLVAEERDHVEWRGPDIEASELRECAGRPVEGCMDGCLRKCLRQAQDDPLCAAALSEIVVSDSDRGTPRSSTIISTHRTPAPSPSVFPRRS